MLLPRDARRCRVFLEELMGETGQRPGWGCAPRVWHPVTVTVTVELVQVSEIKDYGEWEGTERWRAGLQQSRAC